MTPKRGPGRPRNPEPQSIEPAEGDLAQFARGIVEMGLNAMAGEMVTLTAPPVSTDSLDRIVVLTEKSATTMSHIRRADDSVSARARKVTDAQWIEAFKIRSPEVQAVLLDAIGVGANAGKAPRNVLE